MESQYIVKQAGTAFDLGDYRAALALYEKAASQYGGTLFDFNINYCKKRLREHGISPRRDFKPVSVEDQLQQTQQLLEHYFTRSQELESQLQLLNK